MTYEHMPNMSAEPNKSIKQATIIVKGNALL